LLGNKQGVAVSLNNLGNLARNQGDNAGARTLFMESLALRRVLGDKQGIALALNNLGNIAFDQNDYSTARAFLEESLALQREMGDRPNTALVLNNLGGVAHRRGDPRAARMYYTESLAILRELGDKRIAECLVGLAVVASQEEQPGHAARLLGATDASLAAISACLETSDHALFEQTVRAVQTVLGQEQFATAWAEGQAMTIDEAVTYALATTAE
jgi:tetratricopeptide (TPR) repeat protein